MLTMGKVHSLQPFHRELWMVKSSSKTQLLYLPTMLNKLGISKFLSRDSGETGVGVG